MNNSLSVERVQSARLGRLKFDVWYYARNRPVVIDDGAASWQASQRWCSQYLKDVVGEKLVEIKYNVNGVFNYNEGAVTGPVESKKMPFTEAVSLLESSSGDRHYLQKGDMRAELPQLLADIQVPYLLGTMTYLQAVNLWFAGSGSKTPLHYDTVDNFLVQISGRKLITLFPPEEIDRLYPAEGARLPHLSKINIFDPDERAFPRYAKAKFNKIQFVLEAGNMLFIPRRWWHAVESLDVSISVNFWWMPAVGRGWVWHICSLGESPRLEAA